MTIATLLWLGVFRITLVLVAALAYYRGGGPERLAATIFLLATFLSAPLGDHRDAFAHFEPGLAVIDFLVLGLLWLILLFANRWWTIVACGAQLVTASSHLLRLLHPWEGQLAYARMAAFSGWPHLILLQGGTVIHAWRARRGVDPSWSRLPPRPVLHLLRRLRMG